MRTKHWVMLFAAVAAASLAVHFAVGSAAGRGKVAGIYQDGVLIRTVDLSKVERPYEFTIRSRGGGYNVIHVEPGSISVVEASCPDKLCVRHGELAEGAPIVCLPNRLVIRWVDGGARQYDAVTGFRG